MAVYTRIDFPALAGFMAGYNCGEVRAFEGIQAGVENSNFHVFTSREHYILTIFEKRVGRDDLPFIFAFTDHLAGKGIDCPRALDDRHGHAINTLADKPAALINFLEGQQIQTVLIVPEHCRSLGVKMAAMHHAALSFSGERENNLSLTGWRGLAKKTAARADEIAPGLAAIIADELAFLAMAWPADLPKAVIHADLFPDNVFFRDDQCAAFIDFYFSCSDFLAYDFALVINAWCFDEGEHWQADRFAALLDGYQTGRALTKEERSSLNILCRGAAIRILLTRLHDWLFHDPASYVVPKDPREYIAKLKFHQSHDIVAG